jgi:hypothetical protein
VYTWNDPRRRGEIADEHAPSPLRDPPDSGESPEGSVAEGEDDLWSDIFYFLLERLEALKNKGVYGTVSEYGIRRGIETVFAEIFFGLRRLSSAWRFIYTIPEIEPDFVSRRADATYVSDKALASSDSNARKHFIK